MGHRRGVRGGVLGLTHCVAWRLVQNDFISILSQNLGDALRDLPNVYYVRTSEWTRALPGQLGRHTCAPADRGGIHFATGTANMAHLQQVPS